MLQFARRFSTSEIHKASRFKLSEDYKLKCGLEIHAQLNTKYKLFSLSKNTFEEAPNSQISYFDYSLPGTQPILNPEVLLLSLKAAVALNSEVQLFSTFDRKHYFYGDQPLGYQITQHYNPYAKNGTIKLNKRFDDILEEEKIINIEQIQIEQDTGKSTYIDHNKHSKIDLNRSNIPLIEMVTAPDFTDLKQVKAFVKKYQVLLRHLNVCTADLETGAMRVDVNVSINDGKRVEIKNLASTSAISNAIMFEYNRQVDLIKAKTPTQQQTRGWNGSETILLRSKETATDYRYMPDPEIPPIHIDRSMSVSIKESLPDLPDEIMAKLLEDPYNLRLKDVKFLTLDPDFLSYYLRLFEIVHIKGKMPAKMASNWLLNELIGSFTRSDTAFKPELFPVDKLSELITLVHNKSITNVSAKLLMNHLISHKEDLDKPLSKLIEEFDLTPPVESNADAQEAITDLCQQIMDKFPDIVDGLKHGQNLNPLNYLVGQAMRVSQGKIKSEVFREHFKKLIGIK